MLYKYSLNDARGSEGMLFQAQLLYAEMWAPWRNQVYGGICFIAGPYASYTASELWIHLSG